MKKLLLLACAMTIVSASCKIAAPDQAAPGNRLSHLDSVVIKNCETVVAAVDAYAAECGYYPIVVEDFVGYLPNERLLVNPSTAAATEPVDGVATDVGATGYLHQPDDQGKDGYRVTGYGDSTFVYDLRK